MGLQFWSRQKLAVRSEQSCPVYDVYGDDCRVSDSSRLNATGGQGTQPKTCSSSRLQSDTGRLIARCGPPVSDETETVSHYRGDLSYKAETSEDLFSSARRRKNERLVFHVNAGFQWRQRVQSPSRRFGTFLLDSRSKETPRKVGEATLKTFVITHVYP